MNEDLFFKILLFAHIAAGSTALCTGLIALLLKKRRGTHSKVGYIFHVAMLVVAVSAFLMSYLHHNSFLFVVAVFSLYLTFTGYRSIIFMRGKSKPKFLDQAIMIFSALCMLLLTVRFLMLNPFQWFGFSTIILVFDAILLNMLIADYRLYRKVDLVSKNDWLMRHIKRMVPAYIAATTAFLVVNVHYQYPVVVWLAPTVLFLPVIIYQTKKYKKTAKQVVIK